MFRMMISVAWHCVRACPPQYLHVDLVDQLRKIDN